MMSLLSHRFNSCHWHVFVYTLMIESISTLNESKLNSNLAYITALAQNVCCQESRTDYYSTEGLHNKKYY